MAGFTTCIMEDDEPVGLDTIILLDDDIGMESMVMGFVIEEGMTLIP